MCCQLIHIISHDRLDSVPHKSKSEVLSEFENISYNQLSEIVSLFLHPASTSVLYLLGLVKSRRTKRLITSKIVRTIMDLQKNQGASLGSWKRIKRLILWFFV